MKKTNQKNYVVAGGLLLLFLVWTMAIRYVDVQTIGPKNSEVGFATLNGYFHNLTGTHMLIYNITDWLGLVPLFVVLGFTILGLIQLVKRKNLFKVDSDIMALGGFYIIVFAAYILFEVFAINYRPVLIEGYLEASYPSSTTLLVMCVMPTAIMQLNKRIKKKKEREFVKYIILAFTAFMVIGRLISGVHWFTDIIGGMLLSGSLVMLYYSVTKV
ncbi:MAG: phosphatase PAP2 family protein [Anaerostipes sp.]|jgi:membrane-associated phospholipid phosphatase|nr:phosphatase PAP2 family protein [Anaerostipes sp.]